MTFPGYRLVDLTQPIRSGDAVWAGDPPTRITPWSGPPGSRYRLNQLQVGEHSGTHVGAPRHYRPDGPSADEVPVDRLVGRAAVVDARDAVGSGSISADLIHRDEARNGPLQTAELVLFRTGWSSRWGDPEYYEPGAGPPPPTLTIDAVELLLANGSLTGLGIDGPDVGSGSETSAGEVLAARGLLHIENLTNLDALPARGAFLFLGLLPLVDGTGSPARVVALVPE